MRHCTKSTGDACSTPHERSKPRLSLRTGTGDGGPRRRALGPPAGGAAATARGGSPGDSTIGLGLYLETQGGRHRVTRSRASTLILIMPSTPLDPAVRVPHAHRHILKRQGKPILAALAVTHTHPPGSETPFPHKIIQASGVRAGCCCLSGSSRTYSLPEQNGSQNGGVESNSLSLINFIF